MTEKPLPDPTIPIIRFNIEFTGDQLQETRAWIQELSAQESSQSGSPFLVVTPFGMPFVEEIDRWLIENDYKIVRKTPIVDWSATSTAIYPRTFDNERLSVALYFRELWRAVSISQRAERWELSSEAEIVRLAEEKKLLRAECGYRRYRIEAPSLIFHARLQAIHVPDVDRYEIEGRLIQIANLNPLGK